MSRSASPAVVPTAAAPRSAATHSPAAALPRSLRDELTGFAMSFLLHVALLLGMTLIVFVQWDEGRPLPITVSTLAAESQVDDVVPIEVVSDRVEATLPEAGGGLSASSLIEPSLRTPYTVLPLQPSTKSGAGPDRGSKQPFGSDWELPPNAVQAGSFAAWWIPKVERYGEQVAPGQLPRVGQAYRIYVQIRVPDDRRTLRVQDLSGEIIGTDGYKQLIPDRAWVTDEQGELVRAVGNRSSLPVRGGLVEVVFKVDAAGQAGVRDTIRIRSRILNEEQTLTLEFTAAATAGGGTP